MPLHPRMCSPEVGAGSVYSLPIYEVCPSVPSSFKECHPAHERHGQIPDCHPKRNMTPGMPVTNGSKMHVCLETEQESMQTKVV